jgi:CelD/BcsL family acetyltransferase involved in cellulose biosynthesis
LIAEDSTAGEEVTHRLLSSRPRRIELSHIAASDPFLAYMTGLLQGYGYRYLSRPIALAPYLNTRGTWESYQRELGRKRRGELRRRLRRLSELGRLTLDVKDETSSLSDLLNEGFGIESSGWKGEYGTAVHSRRQTRWFYDHVARWAANRGWLRLSFLRLDGRAVAFDYSIEVGSVHYLLKTAYDPAYRALSPGVVLRMLMLQRAFELDEVDRYDFLGTVVGQANRWKLDWTQACEERLALMAVTSSVAGWLDFQARGRGGHVLRTARGAITDLVGDGGRRVYRRARGALRRGWSR